MEDLKLEDELLDEGRDIVPLALGVGPLPLMLHYRSLGSGRSVPGPRNPQRMTGDKEVSEERFLSRTKFNITSFKLALQDQPQPALGEVGPAYVGGRPVAAPTRTTFLMVFSPDRQLVASTHGDHNVYVSRVKDGECLRVLKGHPRTPWCVAFHPSREGLLASGCLEGHVRVWDLSGGSELWVTKKSISSLSFHPTDNILAIASLNELYFWNWSKPKPFAKVMTNTDRDRVQYVKFDALGHKLITGIHNLPNSNPHSRLHYFSPSTRLGSVYPNRAGRPIESFTRRRRRIFIPTYRDMERHVHRSRSPVNNNATMMSRSSSDRSVSPLSTRNSASQTLSDLAQAATNQLMAENENNGVNVSSSVNTSRESSIERDDPFLSDNPYRSSNEPPPSRRRWEITPSPNFLPDLSPSHSPPRVETIQLTRNENMDHNYYRRELRSRMFEIDVQRWRSRMLARRLNDQYSDVMSMSPRSFSHSPESEFVEVTRLHPASRLNNSTEVYSSPNRSSAEANSRFRSQRERQWRDLLDRRQTVVSQIEHLRSAREFLFPAEASLPPNTSPSFLTPDALEESLTPVIEPPIPDHDYGVSRVRPIDDWAANRRRSLERRSQEALDLTLRSVENRLEEFSSRRTLPFRWRHAQLSSSRNTSTVINPVVVSERDAEAATDTLVDDPHQPSQSSQSSATSSGYTGDSRQDRDIVLLSRHIDHMQRICRASLSDIASPRNRQRRQILRLQSISRMLAELQEKIQSLREASLEEFRRRTESLNSELNNVTGRNTSIPSDTPSQAAITRQRATAALHRLRRASGRQALRLTPLISTPKGRTPGRTYTRGSSSSSTRHLNITITPGNHRGRPSLTRSSLRVGLYANQRKRTHKQSSASKEKTPEAKAEKSREVLEKIDPSGPSTSATTTPGPSASSAAAAPKAVFNQNSNELRKLSQRLERIVRDRPTTAVQADRDGADNNANEPKSGKDPSQSCSNYCSAEAAAPMFKRARHEDSPFLEITRALGSSSESDSEVNGNNNIQSEYPVFHGSGRWTRYDSRSSALESSLRELLASYDGRESDGINGRQRQEFGAESRRNTLRERRRLNRERECTRRRRRHNAATESVDPSFDYRGIPFPDRWSSGNDADEARFPPLRELIWRRLRRRNAQFNLLDDEIGSDLGQQQQPMNVGGPRHREMLSSMVDQLTIDQQEQNIFRSRLAASPVTHILTPNANSRSVPTSSPTISASRGATARVMNDSASSGSETSARAHIDVIQNRQVLREHMRHVMNDISHHQNNAFPEHLTMHSHSSNQSEPSRIQSWDFTDYQIPDISDSTSNVVVRDARIYNDASVDISEDGTILVTLILSSLPGATVVGVFSLSKSNLGTCYSQCSLESSAVSVSLSPTAKHLLVGLLSRPNRINLATADRGIMAQVFRIIIPRKRGEEGELLHRKDIAQTEPSNIGLNCIRWVPIAGHGMIYATNSGLLKLIR